jgi:hypothetical protein
MPSEPPVMRTVWENRVSYNALKKQGHSTHSTLDGELVSATKSEHLGKRIGDDGADQYGYSQSPGGELIRGDERRAIRHMEGGKGKQLKRNGMKGRQLPFDS